MKVEGGTLPRAHWLPASSCRARIGYPRHPAPRALVTRVILSEGAAEVEGSRSTKSARLPNGRTCVIEGFFEKGLSRTVVLSHSAQNDAQHTFGLRTEGFFRSRGGLGMTLVPMIASVQRDIYPARQGRPHKNFYQILRIGFHFVAGCVIIVIGGN